MTREWSGPPTAAQVAALAGVSQPTVSRALRGSPMVNEETRERILAVAQNIGYRPNVSAARLRTRRSGVLALVVLVPPDGTVADVNPFYLGLLSAIAAEAAGRGHDLIVSFQREPARFNGAFETSGQADGMIVIGSGQNQAGWDYFEALGTGGQRIVFWGGQSRQRWAVGADNAAGGRMAAEHLVARGCRHILLIGPLDGGAQHLAERRRSFLSTLRTLGCDPVELRARPDFQGDRDSYGYDVVAAAESEGLAFDGAFALSDLMALGALRRMHESGTQVPDRVKLIGFDGIRAGQYAHPPLTTIEQDVEAAGRLLVEMLLARIDDRAFDPSAVPLRLLERGST